MLKKWPKFRKNGKILEKKVKILKNMGFKMYHNLPILYLPVNLPRTTLGMGMVSRTTRIPLAQARLIESTSEGRGTRDLALAEAAAMIGTVFHQLRYSTN